MKILILWVTMVFIGNILISNWSIEAKLDVLIKQGEIQTLDGEVY